MRLYDVTLPIYAGMPVYPGDPEVSREPRLAVAAGDAANVSLLTMGSHTGTHVDAPRHFFDGAPGVDRLPLTALVGPARVVEVMTAESVEAALLSVADPCAPPRVLLKTRHPARDPAETGPRESAALTPGAARRLVEAGVRLVGVDGPSVDPAASAGFDAHRILLRAGIVILEGLDLSGVPPGDYELICLPLKIRDGDGAPARVLLRAPD